jgi:glycosyltransferase involved in cell wall biosynthesis
VMSSVSVIIPCLNEGDFIEKCLVTLLSDLPDGLDIEVLVVDGGSTDRTWNIVEALTVRFPFVRLVDNPRRTAAAAMNIGIAAASGEVIVRVDAHCAYPTNYVVQLTECLEEYDADVVGPVWDTQPRKRTPTGIAIARVLSHPLGVGNAHFRTGSDEVRQVDTVPFGCWRRETLERVGSFSEKLTRSQDFEMARRMKAAGATVLLIPSVVVTYYARSNLRETFRYNVGNGYWVTFPALAYGVRFGLRHYVPVAAVLLGVTMAMLAVLGMPWPLVAAVCAYMLVCAKATYDLRPRKGDPFQLWWTVPFALVSLHAAYGLGGLQGIWGALRVQRTYKTKRAVRDAA